MPKRRVTKKSGRKNPFLDLKPSSTDTNKDKKTRNFTFLYFIVAFVAIIVINSYLSNTEVKTISYSEFKQDLAKGEVSDLVISNESIQGTLKAGRAKAVKFTTARVDDPDLVKDLQKSNVKFSGQYENKLFKGIISWILPFVIIIVIWNLLMKRMGGAPSSVLNFGKSRSRILGQNEINVTFEDVADVEEAKEELKEIIEFLRTPQKFLNIGGKIPKGILLVGAPGTGKTLLAKAVAGEAKVPFFSMSGSDFVEMFVGVGAARVRDLFGQAQEKAPCIIFIDELDALGKARGLNPLASHDEREQTLNQLLAEMDGFDTKKGVIIMAATNRPEILDPALLAAGAVRQARARRQARHQRKGSDPQGPRERGENRPRCGPGRGGRKDAGLCRGRPRQPGERGGPPYRAEGQARGDERGVRRSHRPDARRPGEEEKGNEQKGKGDRGVSRDRPRADGVAFADAGPGAQDLHHTEGDRGPRLYHAAAHRGPLPDDEAGAP